MARAFLQLERADAGARTMAAYSEWIRLVGDPKNREALGALDQASRHDSPVFTEVRRIGSTIDRGLTALLFESGLGEFAARYTVL